MSRFPLRDVKAAELSPLLVRVIDAARYAETHDSEEERSGHAEALRDFGRLATLVVPARGVLAPVEDHLYKLIQQVAESRLDRGDGRKKFRAILEDVKAMQVRDALDVAFTRAISENDTAYYYTGLAFGITFADLSGRR